MAMSTARRRAGAATYIEVDQVTPSPEHLDRELGGDSLDALAESIRQRGVLQPVLVRRLQHGYELIAGLRRWKAARLAGVERIPAIFRP
jgi:ParB family chromosome partitioning protein